MDCSTPSKQRFRNMNSARKFAIMRARADFKRGRPVEATYGYRCECGMVHLTRRRKWDDSRHVLLARLRPTMTLMRHAYAEGLSDALMLFLKEPLR